MKYLNIIGSSKNVCFLYVYLFNDNHSVQNIHKNQHIEKLRFIQVYLQYKCIIGHVQYTEISLRDLSWEIEIRNITFVFSGGGDDLYNNFSWECGGILPKIVIKLPRTFYIAKENHIGTSVKKILWYRQIDTHIDRWTSCYFSIRMYLYISENPWGKKCWNHSSDKINVFFFLAKGWTLRGHNGYINTWMLLQIFTYTDKGMPADTLHPPLLLHSLPSYWVNELTNKWGLY